MVWDDAVAWADSLIYAGYDDWRLPSALNLDGSPPGLGSFTTTESEIAHLFCGEGITASTPAPFTNIQSSTSSAYWTGTEASINNAYAFWITHGEMVSDGKGAPHTTGGYNFAWAVRDGDVTPVPEPTTLLLVGTGLVGLVGFRRKFKKK